ncbi:MAG: hydrogenase maturation protease [Candidatus Omnitrophica bacterium]|nr:hydrogenase maturation protease [Candidatus Omnitrophota bacterium]
MAVKLLVLGLGNTLKMDDGIGIYLVREIEKYFEKQDVKIYEIGTETWRIYSIIEEENCDNILIVDAMQFNFIPGFVYIGKNPEINDFCFLSSHEMNFLSEIDFKFFKKRKNIYIFGVEVYKIDWSIGLSDVLKEKFDEILNKLIELCNLIIQKEIENDLLGIKTI